MFRRGAHLFFEMSRHGPTHLRRALSSGTPAVRAGLALSIVILCTGGYGVLRANGDRHTVAGAAGAAELAVAEIGHAELASKGSLATTSPTTSPRNSRLGKAVSVVPAPPEAPTAPAAPATATPTVAPVVAAPKPAPAPDTIAAYRGLGTWVDWYDYGQPESMDPSAIVDQIAQQGVRTLYLQTGLWAQGPDILNPGVMNLFLDQAHARGIRVVGWYVPGFADIDHDVRASLAVLAYTSPGGQHFDGFSADIEDRTAIVEASRRTVTVGLPWHRGCGRTCTSTMVVEASAVEVLARFDAAISEYSSRLRQSVPAGTTLGAIVPDARNNERSPYYWTGFPWASIAARYDVVLPMAYWSVNKPAACPGADVASYIRDVVAKTDALMGTLMPIHPIGGVADCLRSQDVTTYVDGAKAAGSIGGGLYDFLTTHANPERDAFWATLRRLNG